MTPTERIENAKADAQDYYNSLPEFTPQPEKIIEYWEHMTLRLCDHIDEQGRVIAEFEKALEEMMNRKGLA